MLKIGNKKDNTTHIGKLIEKIQKLPSAFSNLDEDRKIKDTGALNTLKAYPGVSSQDVSNDYLKCRKLINDTLDKYQQILPISKNPSKIMNEIISLEKMLLSEFQGRVDDSAYMVAQGEVGFSNEEKMGTMNIADCVCIVARGTKSNMTALAHIDVLADDEDLINKVFQHLPNEDKEVILIGASVDSTETLRKVLKAILERVKHGDDINIIKSDILPSSPENGYNAFVVCPKTLTVNYRVPGINRGLAFDCYLVSRLIVSYDSEPTASGSFRIEHLKGRLDVAFDLTIQKSFLPIEIHYPGPSNFFNFPSQKFMTVTGNKVSVNENTIDKFVDGLIADSYYEWRRVFVPAEAVGHLKFKDVAVLYRDQLNYIIDEISKLPLYPAFLNQVAKIVIQKRIFIGEGAEKANEKLINFIKDSFENVIKEASDNLGSFERAMKKFTDDLKSYEIPFTTDMKTFNRHVAAEHAKDRQPTTSLEVVDSVVSVLSSCTVGK